MAALAATPPPEYEIAELEEEVPMDVLIKLLHLKYTLNSGFSQGVEKQQAKEEMMKEIVANNMTKYYNVMCEVFGWVPDSALEKKMQEANETRIKELDAKLEDAKENLGDVEIRDAKIAKCDFFSGIGDVEQCLEGNLAVFVKSSAAGPKLDLCFQRIRLGLAFSDNEIAAKAIQDAHKLMKDADWERKNRMKVYEGLYNVCIRNFEFGAQLLIESLSTFASTELLEFKQFIELTTVVALVVLPRAELKKKVVDSPEVLSAGLDVAQKLVNSIYHCRYQDFFPALDAVCLRLRSSVYLSNHINYIFRELRVLAFNQFLDSYSSVTLQSMAGSFAIPVNVLDSMLSTFISNERVAGKIDRVSGNVTTYRGDNINFQYHRILKNGDQLLNRVQKLSRQVEMYSGEMLVKKEDEKKKEGEADENDNKKDAAEKKEEKK